VRLCALSAVRRGHFSRWFGVPALAGYVAFVVAQFVIGR